MSLCSSVRSSVRPCLCPFVCVAFGRRISIEIDFVLCSLKFYVHKVYFDLPVVVSVVFVVVFVVVVVVVVVVAGHVLIHNLNLKVISIPIVVVIVVFFRFSIKTPKSKQLHFVVVALRIFLESKNENEKFC